MRSIVEALTRQSKMLRLAAASSLLALLLAAGVSCDGAGQRGPDPPPTRAAAELESSPEVPAGSPTATATSELDRSSPAGDTGAPSPAGMLEVYFFDVGQGDATLLKGPDFAILVDAGQHNRSDLVPYLQSVGLTSLELVIGTHPHADHIGQIPLVLAWFPVREVWLSGDLHTTITFERVIDSIAALDVGYREPRAGESLIIGSALIEVVNPLSLTGDFHEGSVSVRITYGSVAFLFTGDAEAHTERAMMARGHDLRANVLQLGHHGSRTSSSSEFLQAVSPEVAVYSAGVSNQFGHPHQEVVDRVQSLGIDLYGTAEHGTIVVVTDGQTYELRTERAIGARAPPEAPAQPTAAPAQPAAAPTSPPTTACVNINTAPAGELIQIIHIGPERAQQILQLRPFSSVDDMTRIDGIAAGTAGGH